MLHLYAYDSGLVVILFHMQTAWLGLLIIFEQENNQDKVQHAIDVEMNKHKQKKEIFAKQKNRKVLQKSEKEEEEAGSDLDSENPHKKDEGKIDTMKKRKKSMRAEGRVEDVVEAVEEEVVEEDVVENGHTDTSRPMKKLKSKHEPAVVAKTPTTASGVLDRGSAGEEEGDDVDRDAGVGNGDVDIEADPFFICGEGAHAGVEDPVHSENGFIKKSGRRERGPKLPSTIVKRAPGGGIGGSYSQAALKKKMESWIGDTSSMTKQELRLRQWQLKQRAKRIGRFGET